MTYGAVALTLTQEAVNRMRIAQTAMERIMIGIMHIDRVPIIQIRRQTKVKELMSCITEVKWSWAGLQLRRQDEVRL